LGLAKQVWGLEESLYKIERFGHWLESLLEMILKGFR